MSNLKSWAAPAAVFVTICAVGVSAALLSGHESTNPPAVLHLAAGSLPRAADSAALTTSASGEYKLVGSLPSGRPDDVHAWHLTPDADAARVAKLAAALHAGKAVQLGTTWRAGGLLVNEDGSWSWSPCADVAVSSSGGVTYCAIATPGSVSSGGSVAGSAGSGTVAPDNAPAGPGAPDSATAVVPPPAKPMPAPPVPDATEQQVRAAAEPILRALGLDPSDARVEYSSAVLDPVVDGLPTSGLTTRVDVSPGGTVADASGWLVRLDKGDSYPLITAQQAFSTLPAFPRPMIACAMGPEGRGCPQFAPVQIAGAHLGLELAQLAGAGQALVPAWLFEVRRSDQPVANIAIDPKYLDDGTNATDNGETSVGVVPAPAATK